MIPNAITIILPFVVYTLYNDSEYTPQVIYRKPIITDHHLFPRSAQTLWKATILNVEDSTTISPSQIFPMDYLQTHLGLLRFDLEGELFMQPQEQLISNESKCILNVIMQSISKDCNNDASLYKTSLFSISLNHLSVRANCHCIQQYDVLCCKNLSKHKCINATNIRNLSGLYCESFVMKLLN